MIAFLSFLACKGPATETDTEPGTPAPTETDTDDTDVPTDTDTPPTDTDPPTETDLPPPPVVDCTALPTGPFGFQELAAPRAYHGLAFDEFGTMVGNDGTSMVRATTPDDASLWLPNVGGAEQMDYHPDGDLIVAANGSSIVKVTPAGGTTVLASGINAYGVEVGPDGFIYTANQNRVHRIDPNGAGAEVFIPSSQISVPKVLNFNRDGTRMYVGTNSSNGAVYEVELTATMEPVFPPRLIGNTGGSWHDGLGVDACGNLYINEYWTSSLYLVQPDTDEISVLIDFDQIGPQDYGHGIQWGSGIGPWSDHSIFVPLPYNNNRVAEIPLGVPSKDFNGGYYEIIE